jgi:23S rRNA (adenine2503-C2)-methyltransferase
MGEVLSLTEKSPMQASIYDLDLTQLRERLVTWGEPAYRGMQVWQGMYRQLWRSPDSFTSLSKRLRERLEVEYCFSNISPELSKTSQDEKTVKTLLRLRDQKAIETVLMRYNKRNTLCISSQAGCGMGCVFCATGQMGLKRNLTSGEIIEQVLYFARQLKESGETVTNVVVMGMGEPFQNYDATLQALDRLNDKDGFNLGARRFTISTVGLVPAIRRFAAEDRQYNLAVSLHAAEDELRSSLLPINKKYPLKELLAACRDYVEQTRRRITFEWALIQNVNDSPEQARILASRLKGMLCHVNVIPLNPTPLFHGMGTSRQAAEAFKDELMRQGIPCTVRLRRGIEIQAGCGQLAIQV